MSQLQPVAVFRSGPKSRSKFHCLNAAASAQPSPIKMVDNSRLSKVLLLAAALPALPLCLRVSFPPRSSSSPSNLARMSSSRTSLKRRRSISRSAATATTTTTALGALSVDSATAATSAIDAFFQTQPFLSAFLTCSVKASAADYVAQVSGATSNDDAAATAVATSATESSKQQQDDDNTVGLDVPRNLAFLVYGGLYQGMFQQFLYGVMFPEWFPDDGTWQTIAMQVGIDMTVFTPFLCLPIAYVFKAAIAGAGGEATEDGSLSSVLERGLSRYASDVANKGLLFRYWSLWIPAQSLTFSVVPHHFRILFVACVSFFWMFILSTVSSSTATATPSQTAAAIATGSSAEKKAAPSTATVPQNI